MGVRVTGAGHSFTPVAQTDGLLLDLGALTGVISADQATRRATARAGTPIHGFYEPLWERGLALRNQGDIDDQHIAGAVATATHGSGIAHTCLSGVVRRVRLVCADLPHPAIGISGSSGCRPRPPRSCTTLPPTAR
jgi:FAD/FMN-containing dehydrogenase